MRFSKLCATATAVASTLALTACGELQLDKPSITFSGGFDGKGLTGSVSVTIGGVSDSDEPETPVVPSEGKVPFEPSDAAPENTRGEDKSDVQIDTVRPALSELAPLTSLRPLPRPANSATTTSTTAGTILAQVTMANQHAIRNLPITESLKATIARAVGAVYGLGFEVLVYSGGQHDHETATRLSVPRAGTKAHDHGHAADVYVVAPDGVRLTGDALAPLAQYWLASGHGGVGLEMNGGGVHLDEGRVRFWDYASDGGSVTRTQLAAMLAGKRGVMPTLHSSHSHNPNSEIRSRVRGLLDYIQRYESEGATKSQGVESAYLVVYGGIASGDRPSVRLTNMTVAEVLAWQDSIDAKYSSEAAGAYQVMEDTLRDLVKAARVDANALFDEKVQDTVAELLLERRGLSEFMSGKISAEDFADQLAREWAGFPVVRDQMGHKRYVQRGQSFYAGDGLNKAHADPDEFLSVLRSILSD